MSTEVTLNTATLTMARIVSESMTYDRNSATEMRSGRIDPRRWSRGVKAYKFDRDALTQRDWYGNYDQSRLHGLC